MVAKLIDGRIVARAARSRIGQRATALKASGVEANLVTILVGDDPASKMYLKNKHQACKDASISSRNVELPAETSQRELIELIHGLNDDSSVTGILLQLPLPTGLDDVEAVATIDPKKDVDGLNPYNLGLLAQKAHRAVRLVPCTPAGIMVLLKYYHVRIAGKHAVVVNRSKLVGRPLMQLLLNDDATVTVCHSKTLALRDICRQADVLITGIGHRSDFTIGADMIKEGAAVVDVGSSFVGGKLMGDVDFDSVIQVAGYVTPTPGGVGPMTITMLLYNTLLSACIQKDVDLGLDLNELESSGQSSS